MLILPALQYDYNDLRPFLSKEQVYYHYEKHHAGYYNKVNTILKEKSLQRQSLEQIIVLDKDDDNLYNNAAQAYNHDLYWQCISPIVSNIPRGRLLADFVKYFGGFDGFKQEFIKTAKEHFGSGWCWLVVGSTGCLHIYSTINADSPLTIRHTPLLCCDLWEHAYYLSYKNKKDLYLQGFFTRINWNFVEHRYERTINS